MILEKQELDMQSMKDNVLVAVYMITYNHEKYIAKAIESILMQETSFNYLLIIGEDCSTDNTLTICEKYKENNSDKIKLIRNDKNLGAILNAKNIFKECFNSGAKYIAMCEGDDYWVDPLKLQKQVDFLEAHEDYAICFHEATVLNYGGKDSLFNNIEENRTFDITDLATNNFMATASCVFRNYDHFNPMPSWYKGLAGNDWGLKLLNASKGNIYYMKDCMSVYRKHDQGIWSSLSNKEMYEKGIEIMDALNEAFNYQYSEYFEKGKQLRYERFYPQTTSVVKKSLVSKFKTKIKYYLTKII